MSSTDRPIVLITGAGGNLGRTLAATLSHDYQIVGLNRTVTSMDFPIFAADFSNAAAIELAMSRVRERFGTRIASRRRTGGTVHVARRARDAGGGILRGVSDRGTVGPPPGGTRGRDP